MCMKQKKKQGKKHGQHTHSKSGMHSMHACAVQESSTPGKSTEESIGSVNSAVNSHTVSQSTSVDGHSID